MARTVKTCRLYDATNPTAVTFRSDLYASLDECLRQHGPLQLAFGPDEIRIGEQSIYAARSREDNLALPFFRDGIRTLALAPGITASEVDALLDAVLQVTRNEGKDSDLVTLLWEAAAEHVSIEYVATDGDIDSGEGDGEAEASASATIAPWPQGGVPEANAGSRGGGATPETDELGRSDDRLTAGSTSVIEAIVARLEVLAGVECERLRREHDQERAMPMAQAALELLRACLAGSTAGADRAEFRRFVPRVLHECVAHGQWDDARACLALMRDEEAPGDSAASFFRELEQPGSFTSQRAWTCLDHQSSEQHDVFFKFASELGPNAVEWLMRGLADSQRMAFRRPLARAIAYMAADNPERIAPWLSDTRWYVVRNVVHILGMIGGESVAGLLRAVAQHPEFRVRREVVTAFTQVPHALARPTLLEMLAVADARLLGTILHHLASAPDPELGRTLLAMMEDPRFESRPEEAQRAVLHALAAVGDDSLLPALEARILQGSRFGRGKDTGRFAAALCVARLGTPAARATLERAAASRRAEVARAGAQALAAFRPRG